MHLLLQGKGGVGKSLVASLLAQYYQGKGAEVVCVDTDPVNATFSGYGAFATRRIELLEGSRIDERRFDEMMELILGQEAHFVVDNGASSFIPLSNYLIENEAVALITSSGKRLVIHSVITGGQALLDTLLGLDQLARQLPRETELVVWLNEYFGAITTNGKPFEQMKVYTEHEHRITGLVRLPRQTPDTFGRDMEVMLDRKLTFEEAIASPAFSLMAKQRLALIRRTIFEQLALVI